MKKLKSLYLVLLATMFAFISSCAQNSYSLRPRVLQEDGLNQLVDSVVIIQNGDGTCSGVFVSENEILTAGHCVEAMETITFMGMTLTIPSDANPIGTTMNVITHDWYLEDTSLETIVPSPFEVVRYSNEADLALLRCSSDNCLPHENFVRIIQDPDDSMGRPAFVIGHPAGLAYTLVEGIFSRDVELEDGVWHIFASTTIWFGNSGGPIVDQNGNLVGIASAMMGSSGIPVSHLGLFVHINTIRDFLDGTLVIELDEEESSEN